MHTLLPPCSHHWAQVNILQDILLLLTLQTPCPHLHKWRTYTNILTLAFSLPLHMMMILVVLSPNLATIIVVLQSVLTKRLLPFMGKLKKFMLLTQPNGIEDPISLTCLTSCESFELFINTKALIMIVPSLVDSFKLIFIAVKCLFEDTQLHLDFQFECSQCEFWHGEWGPYSDDQELLFVEYLFLVLQEFLLVALLVPTGRTVPTGLTVPETITEPDHSHDHASTPPRPTTTTSSGPVNEQGPSLDPNIASSSRPHASAPDLFTSTNVEDKPMGGSFRHHLLGPHNLHLRYNLRSHEDLDKLTALSFLVSTLVQKVNTQESEFKAHKLMFKKVVGKLVKKVKLLEDKLKGRKRKFVLTDSYKEEDAEQDVDPLIKLAKAAATAAAASAVPTGGSHEADIPPSSSIPSDEFAGGSAIPAGCNYCRLCDPLPTRVNPSLLVEDPPAKKDTFRQKEEDKLGEEAARRMYEEEQAELEREREEMQTRRQQDVLNSAKYYTDSDWTDIMGQVHANQGLAADLLGPDVNDDNFAERMVALIAKRRREFAAQRSTIYTTGWTMKHVKSFSDDQLKTEFDKIRAAVAELKSLNIKRSLKRPGADLEQASSKKFPKPTEAPQSSVPNESQQPSIEVPSQKAIIEDVEVPSNTASSLKKAGTRKKRLGQKGVHISHSTIPIEDGDPEAKHKLSVIMLLCDSASMRKNTL
ncbi:hypothetical protein Tco_0535225 [Tanacetum coccineum]